MTIIRIGSYLIGNQNQGWFVWYSVRRELMNNLSDTCASLLMRLSGRPGNMPVDRRDIANLASSSLSESRVLNHLIVVIRTGSKASRRQQPMLWLILLALLALIVWAVFPEEDTVVEQDASTGQGHSS
jgi:hypothetical protein